MGESIYELVHGQIAEGNLPSKAIGKWFPYVASRFLFIWMVMLGAMIGIREGTHFEVDVWPALGRRANALLRIASDLFVLVFALVFIWWGMEFARFGWDQLSEIAELPMWTIFIAWPLAGFTWLLFLGKSFIDSFRVVLRAEAR